MIISVIVSGASLKLSPKVRKDFGRGLVEAVLFGRIFSTKKKQFVLQLLRRQKSRYFDLDQGLIVAAGSEIEILSHYNSIHYVD